MTLETSTCLSVSKPDSEPNRVREHRPVAIRAVRRGVRGHHLTYVTERSGQIIASGDVVVTGDHATAERFLDVFTFPNKAPPAHTRRRGPPTSRTRFRVALPQKDPVGAQ